MKNKYQKFITSLFFLLFFLIFSYFEWEEYYHFHNDKKAALSFQENNIEKLNNFSIEDIQDIKDITLYRTPNIDLLEQIVAEIDNAKDRVYLETYILTEKKIFKALKNAKNRWLDVKVLLEKNPYKAYNINNKGQENLELSHIKVQWSDTQDYSLNHSKFLIIDDAFYISTGNYSYSTFKYNRDFFMYSKNTELLDIIVRIFNNDFIWNKKQFYHPNIVLSPFNSRYIFETYFESAEKSIDMYFQYFKDDDLVDLLIEKQKLWIQITAIIPKTALNNNIETLNKMQQNWIILHVMSKNKMHAKAILIDKTYLFIGSINFSSYSLDQNRELWLLFNNNKTIKEFIQYFQDDIANNTVKK
jgi:cardiolipin synthase A/B